MKILERFVEIRSPWLTLIGEKLQDQQGKILDYWRVEKADSVVVVTIQGDRLLLPKPMYRPGINSTTTDFPGGRVAEGLQQPIHAVPQILNRELGISQSEIAKITSLSHNGWVINSSFSNQKLYGFVAEINPTLSINPHQLGVTYSKTSKGIKLLLQDLACLQCRAVLLEWWQVHSRAAT
ncbi:hypothetical protein Xen7305DRAFT_00001240 [Xenococcus sp. PCC 7305]|uniref:hypothetical protein n=1 Tax=Xenococcus sp. PCC 7305 TaxID=102125 RepID=UPI0002ACDD97|nr:hypothetical protein [Xenococcus sp. PCC 7305]ELS00423.1 hypothetical protein Xen7305DRAFT_00001240 [Xenococcus sp. PCC 7305]